MRRLLLHVSQLFKQAIYLIGKRKAIPDQLSNVKAPPYVHNDFETLILSQPQVGAKDIFKLGDYYFILCNNLHEDALAQNGQPLGKWFRDHSTVGSSVRLSTIIPPGAELVAPLTMEQQANLASAPRNQTFLYNDLLSYLPKDFPTFKISDENTGYVFINTAEELTETQRKVLKDCLLQLNEIELNVEFRTGSLDIVKTSLIEDPILLQHSRAAHNNLDTSLKSIIEEDEDFWSTNKSKLIDDKVRNVDFLPDGWVTQKSSCLVSDDVTPDNLRNQLTLYNIVYLRMPIAESHEEYFRNLACSEDELMLLCSIDRVRLVLDQPIHRYHKKLHNIILTVGSNSIIQTRRLAALNVVDLRKRIPFAFPTFDLKQKQELLYELYNLVSKTGNKASADSVTQMLGIMWGDYFGVIERQGIFGLASFGTHHLANMIFKDDNVDRSLSLMAAEPGVNYAASLSANLVTRRRLNDEAYAQFIANIYSGVPRDFVLGKQYESNVALNDILLVNSDVPLLELSETFNSSDIDRLRRIIYSLSKHSKSPDQLISDIESFNAEVRHFVKRDDFTASLDVKGFIVDGGMSVINTNVPFLGWFTGIAVNGLIAVGAKRKTVRFVSDYLKAQISGTIPDAVLVARMRNALGKASSKSKYGY